jgi:DnaJ-class molecular chaperone
VCVNLRASFHIPLRQLPKPPKQHHRKGWKNGTKITYPNEGDELPGVIPADVVFILNTKPHPRYASIL